MENVKEPDLSFNHDADLDAEFEELLNESDRLNQKLGVVTDKLIEKLNSRNTLDKGDKIKLVVFMVLSCALLLSALFLPKPAHAREDYGVDFDLINWSEKCPLIKPVSLDSCEVVHPTSSLILKRTSGFEGLSGAKPKSLDCDTLKRKYEQLLEAPPRKCKYNFKSAYKSLVLFGDAPLFTAEQFRDKYLTEGIVDPNGIEKTRKLLGK